MASIYLCGPSVVVPPHLGLVRSQVNFDVLHRWLRHRGYRVLFCRNVTDIEDKIIGRSLSEGIQWWRIADPAYRSFDRAYTTLGCLPPSVEPRATGHIPEMIELVEQLLAAGHAYESDGKVRRTFPATSGEHSDNRGERTRKARPARFRVVEAGEAGRAGLARPLG
jgi:cysteinyl-tRNA synthetase